MLALQLVEQADAAEEQGLVLQALKRPEHMDEFALAERLKSKRVEPVKVIQWLQQWCYDLAGAKFAQRVRYYQEHIDSINAISKNLPVFDLMQLQRDLAVAKREAYHPLEPKLLFESLFAAYRQALHSRPGKSA